MTAGSSWRTEPAAALRGLAEGGQASGLLLLVEPAEGVEGHVHLAADLDPPRHRPLAIAQAQGQAADGAQVGRHVLAGLAVATGRPADEPALLVGEGDGEPVDLQLGHVGDGIAHRPPHPLVEGLQLLAAEGVVQAEHGLGMLDPGEGCGGPPADPLGRGVGCDDLREPRLQLPELPHQGIVGRIVDRGPVEHVVEVVVVADLLPQFLGPRPGGRQGLPPGGIARALA